MAATFSSTGTPSFLDAANASHGDLGQITSNDIVVLISNRTERGIKEYYSIRFAK